MKAALADAETANRERRRTVILVIRGRSKIGAALIGELLGRGQQVRGLAHDVAVPVAVLSVAVASVAATAR